MLDFLMISTRTKRGVVEIYPRFLIKTSKDLMIRGGDFYAIWIEELGLWSTNEEDAINLIDQALDIYAKNNKSKFEGDHVQISYMWDAETGMIDKWHKYCQIQMWDNYKSLDEALIFSNQTTKKEDYGSKKLSYPLDPVGSIESYDELISVLYTEDERHKIEWCVGAVISGDSKRIQKFAVLYGPPGSGKSTILNIIEMLFDGYYGMFDAESLGSANDMFALGQFKDNPLVAICHDGDLSRIEKNARLNSLVSHEKMTINEKHKAQYIMQIISFLFMGTNKPVRITDAKSGLMRRLIDIHPSGNRMSFNKYNRLMSQIKFELGAIASHCLKVYLEDKHAYDDYKPVLMMDESNDFYNFISDSYQVFKREDGITLKAAWELYKLYVDNAKVPYPFSMRIFKNELKSYFKNFEDRYKVGDDWVWNYYSGFKTDIFEAKSDEPKRYLRKKDNLNLIDFREQPSKLDILCANCPAQYAYTTGSQAPRKSWDEITTTLADIDSSKLHYLKVPENLIVVDFDIKDENGEKSFEKNLEEASKWPKTYSEISKSGGGIHLHYIYNGDPSQLSRIYADNIEIKVFTGNSSLRRLVTKCNDEDINTISSGLPIKEVGRVINFEAIKNEKALRTIIHKNLNKEYHPATKPSMDFIFKVLEDAYNGGINYDVRDLHGIILAFAASSSNQADYCIKLMPKLKLKSEESSMSVNNDEKPIVFYDVEVFPNLFIINWKFLGKDKKTITRMINPTAKEVEALLKYRLVGFNCKRYDNHILYGALIGYTNIQLYNLSQKIINEKQGFFGEAYNISYTDIYDYATKKQSLKKWQVELGIKHKELGLPWDQPVPEHLWPRVAEYCDNDVIATEAVWFATEGDFLARQILATITSMTVNESTNNLTSRLIFGNERKPVLNYANAQAQLQREFPEYKFVKTWNDSTKKYDKANMYRGVDLGFGGYVYAETGMYGNVGLIDVESMHPNTIINLNLFGEYTPIFAELVQTRIYIKHKEYEKAKKLFNGIFADFLDDPSKADALAGALKIAINSVYGLTSASFQNAFRDVPNENNIVALRGALFMKTIQDAIVAKGFKVVHVKTDSIKIPDITSELVAFCHEFAAKYGYKFEHECTFDRMTLVNDAVYIAKYNKDGLLAKGGKKANTWTATGTQFAVPYVFKKLFSKEPIEFRDLCEIKEVQKSVIYLNMDEGLFSQNIDEPLRFIGRVGLFCPIRLGCGGGELVKPVTKKDGSVSYDSVTGCKGYRWLEADDVNERENWNEIIDYSYYDRLVDNAVETIEKYGDFGWFSGDEPYQTIDYIDGKPNYNIVNIQIEDPFGKRYTSSN